MNHSNRNLHYFFRHCATLIIANTVALFLCTTLTPTAICAMQTSSGTDATRKLETLEEKYVANPDDQQTSNTSFQRFTSGPGGRLIKIKCRFASGNSVYCPMAKHASSQTSSDSDSDTAIILGSKSTERTTSNAIEYNPAIATTPKSFYPSLFMPSPIRTFTNWFSSLTK